MTKEELYLVVGGSSSISGTTLNALTRVFQLLLDLGTRVGSAIRRKQTNSYCS